MKILALALLLVSPTAFAKDLNVLRNFALSPMGEGYGLALFFEEANPGMPSDNLAANGCAFMARSKGNFLLSARYKVSFEEETRPSGSDHSWWKQYTNWGPGFDMRVSCKSSHQITDDYVRKVMGGYVRIER
jgi:hypothetical protein